MLTMMPACWLTEGNGSRVSCSRVLHIMLYTLVSPRVEPLLATLFIPVDMGLGLWLIPSRESELPKPLLPTSAKLIQFQVNSIILCFIKPRIYPFSVSIQNLSKLSMRISFFLKTICAGLCGFIHDNSSLEIGNIKSCSSKWASFLQS